MKIKRRWLITACLLLLVGFFVFYRVSAETYGRQLDHVVSTADKDSMLRFSRVRTWETNGRVSILTGPEILSFFHRQLPINPYIFTQFRQMDIRSDSRYVITTERRIYNHINSLLPDAGPYKDRRNLVYEGVELPYAHILETSALRSRIRDLPIPELSTPVDRVNPPRMLLRTEAEWNTFINRSSIPEGLELVVSETIPLPDLSREQFDRIRQVYVLNKNARFHESNGVIDPSLLQIVNGPVPDRAGPVAVFPSSLWTLLLFLTAIMAWWWLGRGLKPLLWITVLFLVYSFWTGGIGFVLGWMAGGLFFGSRTRNPALGFMLAVLWLYGASYQGIWFDPYPVSVLAITVGLFFSFLLWIFPFSSPLSRPVKGLDMVLSLLLLIGVGWVQMLHTGHELVVAPPSLSNTLIISGFALVGFFPLLDKTDNAGSVRTAWLWLPAMGWWAIWCAFPISPLWILLLPVFSGLIYWNHST